MSASATADIIAVLDTFAEGQLPTEATVAVLSDLDRDDAAELAGRWPEILPELRVGILALAVDMASNRIDLDFQRLAFIAIEDPAPGVREAGMYALNDLGGRETAVRIAAVLEKETNPGVVSAGAAVAAPYVMEYETGHLEEETGARLVEALAAHARQPGLPPEAVAHLVEALAPHEAAWVDELIRDAYYSDEDIPHRAAVVAMGRSANEAWLEYLEEQLGVDNSEMRRAAVTACGEIASEDAIEMLVPLLEDENKEVVAATVEALAEIGGDEALHELQEFQDRVPEDLVETLEEATDAARGEIHTIKSVREDD